MNTKKTYIRLKCGINKEEAHEAALHTHFVSDAIKAIEDVLMNPFTCCCLKHAPTCGNSPVFVPYKKLLSEAFAEIKGEFTEGDAINIANSDIEEHAEILRKAFEVAVQLSATLPDGTEGIWLMCLDY